MMDAYIAGAERITGAKSGATYRLPASPWRFVWHSTEVVPSDLEAVRALAARHLSPPHLWAWPEKDWVGQTVPLNLAAYALLHPPGTPETNHRHAIQVEVVGFAKNQPCQVHAAWLGRRVLRPVLDAGVPIAIFNTAPSTDSDGYGVDGAVRQSDTWWAAFDGQCGHANVPDNSHWDPGIADYQTIARAAIDQEDDVTPEQAAQLDKIERRLDVVYYAYRWLAAHPDTVWSGNLPGRVDALYAAIGPGGVDEAEIAAAVLAGLDVEAIAAAIPDTIAADVAQELHERLAG